MTLWGVKRPFHRGCLGPLENKDIYDSSQQQNYSYEVASKIILGLGSPQQNCIKWSQCWEDWEPLLYKDDLHRQQRLWWKFMCVSATSPAASSYKLQHCSDSISIFLPISTIQANVLPSLLFLTQSVSSPSWTKPFSCTAGEGWEGLMGLEGPWLSLRKCCKVLTSHGNATMDKELASSQSVIAGPIFSHLFLQCHMDHQ